MRTHLQSVHGKSNLDDGSQAKRQQSLISFNKSKAQLGKDQYNKLNRALALAIALDMRPISMVYGRGFRYFCHLLNPAYHVPCPTTIKSTITFLYEEAKQELIELLTGCHVAITTDLWTSIGARGYITVTAHFILEWKYMTKVIATRPVDEKHTAANIVKTLEAIQTEFKILNYTGMCTDNAANMKLAGSMMGITHHMCFSHTLQRALQAGLKHDPVRKALKGASNLVSHFNHSSLATTKLKEIQQPNLKEGEKPKSLIQSVCTRWNSEYQMAARLLELRIPVFQVLMDETVTKQRQRQSLDLNDKAWKILEDLVPVLKPFAAATEALTSENSPTLSQVFVLLKNLVMMACKVTDDENTSLKKVKAIIKKELTSRFDLDDAGGPKNMHSPGMIATFLDPRYKALKFLSDQQRGDLTDYITELAEGYTISNTIQEEAVKLEDDSILACLAGDIEIDITTSSINVQVEIQHYLAEPVRVPNPLDWWRMNESR